MPTADRVIKNSVFLLLVSLSNFAAGIILAILLARYWGPSGLGQYSFVFAYTGLFIFLSDLGIHSLLVREVARDRSRVQKYMNNSFGLGMLLSIITYASMVLIINLMDYPSIVTIAVYIAGLYIIIGGFVLLFRAAFNAFERMEYEALTVFVEKVAIIGLAFFVLVSGRGLIELAIIFVMARFLNLLASWIIYRRKIHPSIGIAVDLKVWNFLVKAAFPFGLSLILDLLYLQIDVVMLSAIKGDHDVGLYKAATALIINLPIVAAAANRSLFPVMSKLYVSSQKALQLGLQKVFTYQFALSFPLMVGVYLLADKFILLLYGKDYIPSIISLQILSCVIPLRFLNNTLSVTLSSSDKQGLRTAAVGVAAISNVIMNRLLIPSLSYIGASIAMVLTEMLLFTLFYLCVYRGIYALPALQLIIRPLLSGLIMGAFVHTFDQIPLLMLVGSAAIIYVSVLYLLGGFPKEDLRLLKGFVSPSQN